MSFGPFRRRSQISHGAQLKRSKSRRSKRLGGSSFRLPLNASRCPSPLLLGSAAWKLSSALHGCCRRLQEGSTFQSSTVHQSTSLFSFEKSRMIPGPLPPSGPCPPLLLFNWMITCIKPLQFLLNKFPSSEHPRSHTLPAHTPRHTHTLPAHK